MDADKPTSPEAESNQRLAEEVSEQVELTDADSWAGLPEEQRVPRFLQLERDKAEELFSALGAREQAQILQGMPQSDWRVLLRSLPPDDAADVLQELPIELRDDALALLDKVTRREVHALLAYAEDEAGGLMSPRYARMRPDMTVDEALAYLRRQARRPIETLTYFYVLDNHQVLLGVVSFRDLFIEPGNKLISDIMHREVVSVQEDTDQEEISRLLSRHELVAIPVTDPAGRLKGIVTIDDVVQAMEEEVTEDIQKIGGSEALDAPYLEVRFWEMIRKRASWLSILLVGEMFTASAMAHYEFEIAQAVVLALFIPLVISSGGNSGSQASTLVVRAVALGEVRTRQWFRVLVREICSGLVLGLLLGTLGLLRVVLWPNAAGVYGEHYLRIGFVVAISLVSVVLWGTVAGSMLPLLLKRVGLDPASASAPCVATIVDVTGLVFYFSIASMLLGGILL